MVDSRAQKPAAKMSRGGNKVMAPASRRDRVAEGFFFGNASRQLAFARGNDALATTHGELTLGAYLFMVALDYAKGDDHERRCSPHGDHRWNGRRECDYHGRRYPHRLRQGGRPRINSIVAAKGLETARMLGNFLLETFFDNDPANFHSRAAGKVTTFRKLAERDDLQCSFTVLWNAVAVVEQLRLLPENIADALPMSHHKLLLPVKSPEKKVQLAQEAIDKKLGKREFEDRVKKVKAKETKGEKRGRKPSPEPIKKLRRLGKALEGLDLKRLTPERISQMKPEDVKSVRALVHDACERLTVVRDLLFQVSDSEQ